VKARGSKLSTVVLLLGASGLAAGCSSDSGGGTGADGGGGGSGANDAAIDGADCKTTGCPMDEECQQCLGPDGPLWACIPIGSACAGATSSR